MKRGLGWVMFIVGLLLAIPTFSNFSQNLLAIVKQFTIAESSGDLAYATGTLMGTLFLLAITGFLIWKGNEWRKKPQASESNTEVGA